MKKLNKKQRNNALAVGLIVIATIMVVFFLTILKIAIILIVCAAVTLAVYLLVMGFTCQKLEKFAKLLAVIVGIFCLFHGINYLIWSAKIEALEDRFITIAMNDDYVINGTELGYGNQLYDLKEKRKKACAEHGYILTEGSWEVKLRPLRVVMDTNYCPTILGPLSKIK